MHLLHGVVTDALVSQTAERQSRKGTSMFAIFGYGPHTPNGLIGYINDEAHIESFLKDRGLITGTLYRHPYSEAWSERLTNHEGNGFLDKVNYYSSVACHVWEPM